MELEATHLRGNRYAVGPKGFCGTCGWRNGIPWTVNYVNARNADEAVRKSQGKVFSNVSTVQAIRP